MSTPAPARSSIASAAPLLAAFGGAVAIRVALAGPAGARSVTASATFAAVLAGVAAVSRLPQPRLDRRVIVVGLVTTAAIAVPAVLRVGVHASLPASDLPGWALLTVAVATAEEAFLRGVLFDAVQRRRGLDVAVVVTAVAFALLHVPFYGWSSLPLDLAVGLALGAARVAAGTWTAPAIAHVSADLVGWWLL